MDTKPRNYSVAESDQRIKDIIGGGGAFEERDSIPTADALTYSNGFYVECVAVFIDIRDSSKLTSAYTQRRSLGKLYRAYLSECVAVINATPHCRQVFIQGDQVSGVLDAPNRQAVQDIFPVVFQLNGLVRLLNYRLRKAGMAEIRCGIGIDKGRALMLKAGFAGSGINDVVWMGDVMNHASKLCHQGSKDGRLPIQVSESVHSCVNQRELHESGIEFLQQGIIQLAQGDSSFQCDLITVEMVNYLNNEESKANTTLLASMLAPAPISAPSAGLAMASLLYPNQGKPQGSTAHSLADLVNGLGQTKRW